MNKSDLQSLIDRVIGSKGILRVPAWWVRRLFSELLGYTDTAVESAKEYTDTAVSNIEIDVDAEISDTSENPVQNKVVKAYVDSSKVTVDSSISDTSENPVQNKVVKAAIDAKQDLLVSGTNIKTVNGESILGSGDIEVSVEVVDGLDSESTTAALSANQGRVLNEGKQDALVSGTNIKTINNHSILGSGNITIEGGGGGGGSVEADTEMSNTSENPVQNKVIKAYVDGLVGEINTVLDTINGKEI